MPVDYPQQPDFGSQIWKFENLETFLRSDVLLDEQKHEDPTRPGTEGCQVAEVKC